MIEDDEFVSSVKDLASSATLAEILRRIEKEQIDQWILETLPEKREQCWHGLQAIQKLAIKIQSFTTDEKVRAWTNAKALRRI